MQTIYDVVQVPRWGAFNDICHIFQVGIKEVKGNPFLTGNVGNESMTCPNTFSYNPDLIDCLLDETKSDNCDEHV